MTIRMKWNQGSKSDPTTEIRWRRSLLAYVREGTTKAAAKKLKLKPSTITMHIQMLETKYGLMLERTERGWRKPILNSYAQKWLEQYEEFSGGKEVA